MKSPDISEPCEVLGNEFQSLTESPERFVSFTKSPEKYFRLHTTENCHGLAKKARELSEPIAISKPYDRLRNAPRNVLS